MEEDLKLFSLRVNGIAIWERIRSNLFLRIYQNTVSRANIPNNDISFIEKAKFYLKSVLCITRNPFFASEKEIVFFGSPRRIKREDGYWWDIYIDFIQPHLYNSSLAIERDFEFQHRTPAKTSDLYYLDILEFLIFLKGKLGLTKIRIPQKSISAIQNISREILKRFGAKINVQNLIKRNLSRRNTKISFYQKILKKLETKLAVIVTSYGKEDFIESAKALNIPVIELQHGVISKFHPGYSYPGKQRTKRTFPDFLLTFGDFWKRGISYPVDKSRVVPVGYPYLEVERQKHSQIHAKKQILVLSQGRIGDLISKFAVDMSKFATEYSLIYKLHPAEVRGWEERYPWLADSDVTVIDDNDKSLYELFSESTAQVGVFSTAIFEGLAFGLRTFLIDITGIGYMNSLLDAGIALKVSTPEEIYEHLEDELMDSEEMVGDLFREKSILNITGFISKLLEKRKSL